MTAETEYGWRVLREGVPGREWVTAWMDIDKFHRDALRHNKFTYGSPYRPVDQTFRNRFPDAAVANIRPRGEDRDEYVDLQNGGTRSLICTKEPLDHEALYRWELIPVSASAIGWYIMELAHAEEHPVELSMNGDRAALLFKNPRGIWQMSYFDERGPVGHDEGKDPGKLAYEAYLTGYRTWAPGIVDSMAESFEGLARG